MRAALPVLIAACAALLAGCGKTGELERPGPLFGKAPAGAAAAPQRDPDRALSTIDPRDNARTPAPANGAPLPAAAANPDTVGPAAAEPEANTSR